MARDLPTARQNGNCHHWQNMAKQISRFFTTTRELATLADSDTSASLVPAESFVLKAVAASQRNFLMYPLLHQGQSSILTDFRWCIRTRFWVSKMQKAAVVTAFYSLSCWRVIGAIVAFPEFLVGFIVYFFDLSKVFGDYFSWRATPKIFGHGGTVQNTNTYFLWL